MLPMITSGWVNDSNCDASTANTKTMDKTNAIPRSEKASTISSSSPP